MNKKDALLRNAMPLLQWDEQKYATGFAHIDEQHRELFDGLNGLTLFLQNSLVTDDDENQGKVIELLYFLGEYAMKHFREEEEIFAQCGHPMALVNIEAHQAFFEKFLEYNDQLVHAVFSRDLLMQLHIFLNFWLVNHIVKVDAALRECAEKPGMEALLRKSRLQARKQGVFSKFLALFERK